MPLLFFLQIHCGFGEWLLVNLSVFSNIWHGTIIVWGSLTLRMPLNLIYVLETVKILWRSKFLSMFSASENSFPSERWTLFSVCISHHWPSPLSSAPGAFTFHLISLNLTFSLFTFPFYSTRLSSLHNSNVAAPLTRSLFVSWNPFEVATIKAGCFHKQTL